MHFFQALVALPLIAGAVASPLDTRATLENCNDEGVRAINNALTQAAEMANSGASLIRSESDYSYSLFQSFFKTNDAQARNHVADVLDTIATEATNGNQGVVTYYCTPEGIECTNSHSFTMTAYGDRTEPTEESEPALRTLPIFLRGQTFAVSWIKQLLVYMSWRIQKASTVLRHMAMMQCIV